MLAQFEGYHRGLCATLVPIDDLNIDGYGYTLPRLIFPPIDDLIVLQPVTCF